MLSSGESEPSGGGPSAFDLLPRVAIVGRPNVGKSTLFNRIIGRRQAIVGDQPGLTRDRHLAEADWAGRSFVLVDTGGLEKGSSQAILQQVERQVLEALESADVILFVVDGRQGVVPVEAEIGATLRRRGVPVIVVVNKCDTRELAAAAAPDFHALGLEPVMEASAEHGRGVAEVLDAVLDALPQGGEAGATAGPDADVRVAVVGRPNVGKSSLVNALLGASRVVVSDEPGTTRDAVDSVLERDGRRYLLVDTAGIRRRARVDTHAEIASVAVARRRLARADVALLLVDPHDGVTRQDLHIAAEAQGAGCGLVVVVNKWDTVEDEPGMQESVARYVRRRLGRMEWAPIVFISATQGMGLGAVLPLVDRVATARSTRISTGELNAAFERIVRRNPPPGGISRLQAKYLTQVGVSPPTFVVFAPGGGGWRFDYRRYLENRLRESFDFTGTPLVIRVRRGKKGRRRPSRARGGR